VAAKAKAVQHRFGSVKIVADRAGEVWVNAEIKLGQEMAAIPGSRI
jgi:hypothetical protein